MKEAIMNYTGIILSDINFMLAMLIIVLVAACFLGRYIVITRKMVLATLGVLIIQIVFLFASDFLMKSMYPDAYKVLEGMESINELTPELAGYEEIQVFSSMSGLILNGLVFVYAFVFYLIANKEKRIIRAVESLICLMLYYQFVNSIFQYMYLYFNGCKQEIVDLFISGSMAGLEGIKFTFFLTCAVFIISVAILLILYFGYYRKKRVYVVRIRDRVLFVLWLIIFGIFPGMPIGPEKLSDKFMLLSIIFGVMLLVLGILAPVILVMNAADKSLREKNEYQETYLNAELEYIERYKNAQTETRAFRHDIINNLSLTSMMLDEGKVEDASQHLKELLGNVRALSPSIITGDEMLDCIVAMKADKMKELDIRFTTDGVVDGGLHMKPMDVCSIFANALDNAIEAARKVEKEPWIDLKIKRTEKFFVLKISNAAEGKVNVEKLFMSNGYTSKNDKEHHGFGLRNIRQAVEEYDGMVKAEAEEGTFGLSIMIPRK